MGATTYSKQGSVAVIKMDSPPVNSLSHALRTGIVDDLEKASIDKDVKAVVLIGNDKGFSAGAEIREFNTPAAEAAPVLPDVIKVLDTMDKPVVAAMHGLAMGGGFELALGCHYRVAVAGCQLSFPEVKLGLLPGAGGTQRFPRVVGYDTALNMIVSGAATPSEMFKGSPLFDKFFDGDLLKNAVAFANEIADKRPLPLVKNNKVPKKNYEGFFQWAKMGIAPTAKKFPAPLKCFEAVKAAVELPFNEGMRFERDAFISLVNSPESRACRNMFFAERENTKIPDVPADTKLRPINKVAIIGAGTMGQGISMSFAVAGIPVRLLEIKQEYLDKGIGNIKKLWGANVAKGKMKQEKFDSLMASIQGTLNYDDLKDCDLVVEAVFEDWKVKEDVWKKLDAVMKPGAILGSNTSYLDMDKLATFTKRPGDFVGLHFFSPANVMKLLEVVRAKQTSKDVLATVMDMAKKIKKIAVVAKNCDGFIGNRMLAPYLSEAGFMLEEGATPWQIDKAMNKFGMAMGPFAMGDMAGGDIGWATRKRMYVEYPNKKFAKFADKLCELGRYGQKTGSGYYKYEAGNRTPIPDPLVEEMLVKYSAELGITRRKISDDEIVERLVLALVNEGAKCLDDGTASRASDIDLVYIYGYGFPPNRGGPMCYASEMGMYNVLKSIKRFGRNPNSDPEAWKPAAIIEKLAAAGKSF